MTRKLIYGLILLLAGTTAWAQDSSRCQQAWHAPARDSASSRRRR